MADGACFDMLRGMPAPLTELLNSALSGDAVAAERAWTEDYGEVRTITANAIARERGVLVDNGDLHPTVLVNEIFLRIGRNPPRAWDSRRHFYGAVSQACEQVLVDLARARQTLKRGGGKQPVPLTFVAGELAEADSARGAADIGLPAALDKLAREYPRAAEVARLRYMLGFPTAETARILGVSESTVEKDWAFARAWLRRELERAD